MSQSPVARVHAVRGNDALAIPAILDGSAVTTSTGPDRVAQAENRHAISIRL